jgi:FkbM family methyltransferase
MLSRVIDRLGRASDVLSRCVAIIRGKTHRSASIRGAGAVQVRTNSTDYRTFEEIFLLKAYDFSNSGQYRRVHERYESILAAKSVPVIVDAGANAGAASIWFASLFPKARILAIEPDPDNAEMCRLNTAKYSSVIVIEGAIGSETGRVTLSNPWNEAWAVQTIRDDMGNIKIYTVPDLVYSQGPTAELFLTKIDIEGFEDDLFCKNTDWVSEAMVIMIELHDWLFPGKGTSSTFQQVMGRYNFEILISGNNLIYIRL